MQATTVADVENDLLAAEMTKAMVSLEPMILLNDSVVSDPESS